MNGNKEEERICREIRNPEGLTRFLANQAGLLAEKLNKLKQAAHLIKEAYTITQRHGLSALSQKIKPMLDSILSKYEKGGR